MVYDKVIVSRSSCSESLTMSGATKKTTVISRFSPASGRWSVKQKQLIFEKYAPTVAGDTLYEAIPTVSRADSLTTRYLTVTTSPIFTSIEFCSGSKRHGRPPATLAWRRTLTLGCRISAGGAGAT